MTLLISSLKVLINDFLSVCCALFLQFWTVSLRQASLVFPKVATYLLFSGFLVLSGHQFIGLQCTELSISEWYSFPPSPFSRTFCLLLPTLKYLFTSSLTNMYLKAHYLKKAFFLSINRFFLLYQFLTTLFVVRVSA